MQLVAPPRPPAGAAAAAAAAAAAVHTWLYSRVWVCPPIPSCAGLLDSRYAVYPWGRRTRPVRHQDPRELNMGEGRNPRPVMREYGPIQRMVGVAARNSHDRGGNFCKEG